jgi:hypothetical protein
MRFILSPDTPENEAPHSVDIIDRLDGKVIKYQRTPLPLMDKDKFKKLSASLFASAAAHAERDETEFVGGDPDQWFQIHGQYSAFEAAVEYFDNCDFKYAT